MIKPKAHFLHIGKTGGSAVKNALKPHLHAGKYGIVLHNHRCRLEEIPNGEAFFFLLRHPVTRFTSAFNSRRRQGLPRYQVLWSAGEATAFASFQTANELAEALSAPDDHRRYQAQLAMSKIKHVRTSVWYWFRNPAYFAERWSDLLFVGFQETLNADFQRLLHQLALDENITLPTTAVAAHQTPDGFDQSLSELGQRNLLAHYARDVAFYEAIQATVQATVQATGQATGQATVQAA